MNEWETASEHRAVDTPHSASTGCWDTEPAREAWCPNHVSPYTETFSEHLRCARHQGPRQDSHGVQPEAPDQKRAPHGGAYSAEATRGHQARLGDTLFFLKLFPISWGDPLLFQIGGKTRPLVSLKNSTNNFSHDLPYPFQRK